MGKEGTPRMRAVVLEQYGQAPELADVEPLDLRPSDFRVAVGASGVCHSDVSVMNGQYPYLKLPLIMGHEGAGTVEEIGSAVTTLTPGDRVIASWRSSCGRCWQCVRHRQHLCETSAGHAARIRARRGRVSLTAHNGLGTLSELMTVDEGNLVKVQTDLPDEQLALIGCGVTTGVGAALWTAEVLPGSTVAVFGCGGVGLAVIQGACIAGASAVIAVDPFAGRREAALGLGATEAVDPEAGDAVEQIRELTDGRGVEYAFEAVGRVETMVQSYHAAARGGTIVFVGALPPDVGLTLPANAIHAESKRILGSSYGSAQVHRDMPRLVALAEAGRLDISAMVSSRIGLDEVQRAFDAIEQRSGVRTVVVP
jgi:S-(hydroxymethyl)glutathione dehydrogenase / alcohol dehydrogenase